MYLKIASIHVYMMLFNFHIRLVASVQRIKESHVLMSCSL